MVIVRDYGNEVGIEKLRGIQELFQKKKGWIKGEYHVL